MTLLTLLLIFCAMLFGLLGIFLLITKKGHPRSNRFLAIFLILWAIDFVDGYFLISGFYLQHVHWALWTDTFFLLYGPAIYFYTILNIFPSRVLKPGDLKHLTAFAVLFLLLTAIYHSQLPAAKYEILMSVERYRQPPGVVVGFLLAYLHFYFYLFGAKTLLKQARKAQLDVSSQPQYKGLAKILNVSIIMVSLFLLNTILQLYAGKTIFETGLMILLLMVGLLLSVVMVKTLDQSEMIVPSPVKRRSGMTQISQNELQRIASDVSDVMEQYHLYLNADLTLEDLAKAIAEHPRNLSLAINSILGKNFFDLVNSYRIEAAKARLKNRKDPGLTILEVMYEVGFNSKSSFNTQFRQKTGMTPSQYIRRLKSRSQDFI
jgi:AraC-like DNA-binding protein